MPCKDKASQAISAKKHYEKNKVKMKARAMAHKAVSIARKKQIVVDYLNKHPCVDCGESDIIVLEFDHRIPEDKSFSIGAVISREYCSMKRFLEEIGKCDVRCCNCHRRKTSAQFRWYKSLVIEEDFQLPLF